VIVPHGLCNCCRFNFLLFLSTDLSLACLPQVLLKPIVSQFVIQPPTSLEENPNIPSMKEVDDLLVVCIGQMAVTAGTDLLWKPLNHEVSLKAITLVCGSLSNLFISLIYIHFSLLSGTIVCKLSFELFVVAGFDANSI
jgi:hypothetical protein